MIDISGSGVTENDVLAHALTNTSKLTNNIPSYLVQCSSAFVNEYTWKDYSDWDMQTSQKELEHHPRRAEIRIRLHLCFTKPHGHHTLSIPVPSSHHLHTLSPCCVSEAFQPSCTLHTSVWNWKGHQKSHPKANHPLSGEEWHVHINMSIPTQMQWYNTHHGFLFYTCIAWVSCRNDDTRLPTSLETRYWYSCHHQWDAMSCIICNINEIQPYTIYNISAGLCWPPVYESWFATSTATSVKSARALTGGEQLVVGDLKSFFLWWDQMKTNILIGKICNWCLTRHIFCFYVQ